MQTFIYFFSNVFFISYQNVLFVFLVISYKTSTLMILFTEYKTLFIVRKIVTILGLSYVMYIKLEERKKGRGGIENRPINLIFHDR